MPQRTFSPRSFMGDRGISIDSLGRVLMDDDKILAPKPWKPSHSRSSSNSVFVDENLFEEAGNEIQHIILHSFNMLEDTTDFVVNNNNQTIITTTTTTSYLKPSPKSKNTYSNNKKDLLQHQLYLQQEEQQPLKKSTEKKDIKSNNNNNNNNVNDKIITTEITAKHITSPDNSSNVNDSTTTTLTSPPPPPPNATIATITTTTNITSTEIYSDNRVNSNNSNDDLLLSQTIGSIIDNYSQQDGLDIKFPIFSHSPCFSSEPLTPPIRTHNPITLNQAFTEFSDSLQQGAELGLLSISPPPLLFHKY